MGEILIRKPTSRSIPRYWLFTDWNRRLFSCHFSEFNGTAWQTISRYAGQSSQFFEYIGELHTKKNVCIWIVGWNIYEHLCCSDLYTAIQSGIIRITDGTVRENEFLPASTVKKMIGGLVCENPPTIIDAITLSGQRVKFLDIANWGIKRKDICNEEIQLDATIPQRAIEDLVSLLRLAGMGQCKQTAASQGYYTYRMRHMQHEIHADSEPTSRDCERRSYIGGRAECFRLGRIPGMVWHLDVKSMYSSIGSLMDFPTRLIDYRLNPSVHAIAKLSTNNALIAHVSIDTSEPCYPLKIDKRVIYPIGKFDTWLAGPELLHAYRYGRVTKVHTLCRYHKKPIFTEFARWYFETLQSLEMWGLTHLKGALKLIVNATYGKIGQRSKLWVDVDDGIPRYPYEQWWGRSPKDRSVTQFRSIDGSVQYLDVDYEPPTSCPAISSYMCSYGRMKLWDMLCTAGFENVYYCDTDGVMVNSLGYESLTLAGYVKPNVYGALSVREVSDNVELFGIKHYRFGDRWCVSGVPDGKITRINGRITFEQHSPFADGLWHRKGFEHEYRMITRSYTKDYKHGVVMPDGTINTFVVATELITDGTNYEQQSTEAIPRIVGATRFFASES